MNIYWRIASYLIAIAVAIGGLHWYGSRKYDQGYDKAVLDAQAQAAKISEQYRKQEQDARKKAEERYAKYEEEKAKTAAARDRLANLYSGLRTDYEAYKRAVSNAANDPVKASRIGAAGIRNLESCTTEYKRMAEEYAGSADQLNGLISQCTK